MRTKKDRRILVGKKIDVQIERWIVKLIDRQKDGQIDKRWIDR